MAQVRQNKTTINGFEMAWREAGSGDAIVLLHAFPLSSAMWGDQLDAFADLGWRVIAPDFRGFGDSTLPPDQTNTMTVLADDVAKLLDHLQIEQAVIVGLSMGGYVAFALLKEAPERFRALILADTKAEPDTTEARANRYKLRDAVKEKGSSAAAEANTPKLFAPSTFQNNPQLVAQTSGLIEQTNPETIIATLPGLAERPDMTWILSQIQVPTLVIHGRDDQLMPLAGARAMAEAIPDWQFAAVPQAGHLSNLENPTFFNNAVASFLKGLA